MQHTLFLMPASLHTVYTFSFSHFRIHIPLFISQFLSAIFQPSKYMLFQPHKHTAVFYNLHPVPTIRLGRQATIHILANIS